MKKYKYFHMYEKIGTEELSYGFCTVCGEIKTTKNKRTNFVCHCKGSQGLKLCVPIADDDKNIAYYIYSQFYTYGWTEDDLFLACDIEQEIYDMHEELLEISDNVERQRRVDMLVAPLEVKLIEEREQKEKLDFLFEDDDFDYLDSKEDRDAVAYDSRTCHNCGCDISHKPSHHYLCYSCFMDNLDNDDIDYDENEYDDIEDDEEDYYTRTCDICGCDISDRPPHHYLCYSCFTNGPSEDDRLDSSNDDHSYNYNDDYSYDETNGYDDEWGYYNIHGEMPPPGWGKKKKNNNDLW
ncbi:hypothetical protein [Acholeplasma laidlawii]|uniref:hypothetical protein n=1 Tax=Acholeplasma laidlawii TaxID=2148 RepID=UPI003F8F4117